MPFIPPEERPPFDEILKQFDYLAMSGGQAVYTIRKFAKHLLKAFPRQNFDARSEVHKLLVAAERDWWDREVRPYEDRKERENGPVT